MSENKDKNISENIKEKRKRCQTNPYDMQYLR